MAPLILLMIIVTGTAALPPVQLSVERGRYCSADINFLQLWHGGMWGYIIYGPTSVNTGKHRLVLYTSRSLLLPGNRNDHQYLCGLQPFSCLHP